MKETTFLIRQLNDGWDWPDIYNEEDVALYCCEELEIPAELIDAVECFGNAFRLSLMPDRSYRREDWYVNLQRSA